MRNIFYWKNLSWVTVLFIAAVSGLLAGLFHQIGYMGNTSFTDFFVAWEWWIFFGLFIAANNSNAAMSLLQTILFFGLGLTVMLLAQWPVIGKGGFISYIRGHIILFLIVTIVGGILIYLATLKGVLFGILMAAAETVTAICFVNYVFTLKAAMPRHILSAVFCLLSYILTTFQIVRERASRAVVLSISIVLALVYAYVRYRFGLTLLAPRF